MKIKLLVSIVVAALLSGCVCDNHVVKYEGKSGYQVTLLGDIHFDGAEYHIAPPKTENSKRERIRNINQWKGKSQQVLDAAAKQSKNTAPFIIQLGDITQGDCDNAELQGAAFKGAFAVLKKFFPGKKIFSINGNHDVRGAADAPQAADRFFIPLLKKELGKDVEMDGTNYAFRYGKDLYIFYDYSKQTSGEFTCKAIGSNPDARHIFFMTHLPLFPCSGGNPGWIVKEAKDLVPLFAKHNVIVLCAHTHMFGYIVYKNKDGVIPQLTVNSMGINWTPGTKLTQTLKSFDEWKNKIHPRYYTREDSVRLLPNIDYFKNSDFIEYSRYTATPSGFVKLEVTDDKVTALIYTDNSGKPVKSIVLKGNK